MRKLTDAFEHYLIQKLGYDNLIRLEDAIAIMAGFLLGIAFAVIGIFKLVQGTERLNDNGEISVVRVEKKGKIKIYSNYSSIPEFVDALYALLLMKCCNLTDLHLKNTARNRVIIYLSITIIILAGLLGVYFALNVIKLP